MTAVGDRIAEIRKRIAAAAARRGPGRLVTLVAVSKRQPLGAVEMALAAGQHDFGENYAQELADKRELIGALRARWHFIGPLQSNKARLVIGSTLIHTVDREKIIEALQSRAEQADLHQDVLVQVNIAGDEAKSGVAPEEVEALLDCFAAYPRVRCRGLMTMPPVGTPEQTRPHFAALRRLAEHLAKTPRPGVQLVELSMGMSDDFEVAIEEGATIVRVGTAIFGERHRPTNPPAAPA